MSLAKALGCVEVKGTSAVHCTPPAWRERGTSSLPLCLLEQSRARSKKGDKEFHEHCVCTKNCHLLSNNGVNPKSVSETFALLHSLFKICSLLAEQNCFYGAVLAFQIFQLAPAYRIQHKIVFQHVQVHTFFTRFRRQDSRYSR